MNKKDIMKRPHLVILGAGASVAAFPNGDANHKTIPTMDNFIKTIKIKGLIDKEDKNIEDIYSELSSNKNYQIKLESIESQIRKYFFELELPDNPTLYDHLILSLTRKDIIATFNWDPLLWKACQRIHKKVTTDVPELVFLHGNVAIKIDYNNKRVDHSHHEKSLIECPLLFPIKDKNYDNPFIDSQWQRVQDALNECYYLTIFGYSAPKSDIKACALMNDAFSTNPQNNLGQIEIIDIKSKDMIMETWADFITKSNFHYDHYNCFYDSILASCPRKTCEVLFEQTQECQWDIDCEPIPINSSWEELCQWYKQLN